MNFSLFKSIAILPLLFSFFLSIIAVPAVIEIAKYFELIDDPKKRPHPAHTEKRTIPRAGGLAILLAIVIATAIFIPFAKGITGIMLGACLIVAIGLIDDKNDIHPYIRLTINICAALLAVAGGAGIGFITNPITGGIINLDTIRWSFDFLGKHSLVPIADFFAVIWLVWVMNLVGWSSGVDGQMPGFVAISAFIIGLLSFSQISIENFPAWTGTTLAFITTGAYLGFIPWNFFPQKIMPGYSGKALAGFLLGTLAILTTAKLGTALLVLGVPAIDSIYVGLTRLLKRTNPTLPGRSHLHHKLLDIGWSKRKIALFYWGVSAILGIVALTVNSRQKIYAVLATVAIVAGIVIWVKLSTTFLKKSVHANGSKT